MNAIGYTLAWEQIQYNKSLLISLYSVSSSQIYPCLIWYWFIKIFLSDKLLMKRGHNLNFLKNLAKQL